MQVAGHAVLSNNTLAYFATAVSYACKMFMKSTPGLMTSPGPCAVKHFTIIIVAVMQYARLFATSFTSTLV